MIRKTRSVALFLAVLTATLSAITSPVSASPPSPAGASARSAQKPSGTAALATSAYAFDYLDFNMCGNVCNSGGYNVVSAIESSVINRSPRPWVITLQEVCWNQWNRLKQDLAGYGYDSAWFQWNGRDYCHTAEGDAYYGIAIIHKSSGVLSGNWTLPNPYGNEPRRMFCVQVNYPTHYGCVTHVDYHSNTYPTQIQAVADHANGLWTSTPYEVIVGGDYNAEPSNSAMNPMYDSCYGGGAYGRFRDANSVCVRGGEATHDIDYLPDNKLDYVFASPLTTIRYGDPTSSSVSDHDPYWAGFTVNL